MILIAIPVHEYDYDLFAGNAAEIYNKLSFGGKITGVYHNGIRPQRGDGRYSCHARARNQLIDAKLRDDVTHVMWIDCDLYDVPADIVQRLLAIGGESDIAAPAVLRQGDRLFWDIGGFIYNGQNFSPWAPYCDYDGDPIPVDSVGCCYLIPAKYYRQGLRYEPRGDEVEHVSLFRGVREAGGRLWATRQIEVTHHWQGKGKPAWFRMHEDRNAVNRGQKA